MTDQPGQSSPFSAHQPSEPAASDERQRRIEALRQLGHSQPPAASEPAVAPATRAPLPAALEPRQGRAGLPGRATQPRRRLPVWARITAGVLAACAIAAGLYLARRPHQQPTLAAHDPLIITFAGKSLDCPARAAWSPDGKRIALAGYDTCHAAPLNNSGPLTDSTLIIYDSATGKALRYVPLDAALIQAVVPKAVAGDTKQMRLVAVQYNDLAWSPDGQQMALSFNVFNITTQNGFQVQGKVYGQGLVLIPNVGAPRVLVAPVLPPGTPPATPLTLPLIAGVASAAPGAFITSVTVQASGTGAQTLASPASAVRWNLAVGTPETLSLPQALGYTWNGDGTLQPVQPLPTAAGTPLPTAGTAPAGNPSGGAGFSMWQQATIQQTRYCPAGSNPPAAPSDPAQSDYYWVSASTLAWSPDGRYLLTGLTIYGRLSVAQQGDAKATPTSCVDRGSAKNWAPLPPRDNGLTQATTSLDPVNDNAALAAWDPSGRHLAVEQLNAVPFGQLPRLVIYDAASGKALAHPKWASLEPRPDLRKPTYFGTLAWSPDGARLLLLDTQQGVMTILGARSLGL